MFFRGLSACVRDANVIRSRVSNVKDLGPRIGIREMSLAEFGKGGGLKVMAIRRYVVKRN